MLAKVNLPNLFKVGRHGFSNCISITKLNLVNLVSVGDYGFHGCN
jgi:hypothetical protein